MIDFYFLIGCRNCLQSDGMDHLFNIMKGNPEDYIKQSEYDVACLLEQWMHEKGKICAFCGSSNIEINNVRVGNYKLFDFDALAARGNSIGEDMFQLKIDKLIKDSNCVIGGSRKQSALFLRKSFQLLLTLIEKTGSQYFISHSKGNLFICITGMRGFLDDYNLKIERFRYAGFEKEELVSILKNKFIELGF